jgi:hypothetical protein
MGEWNCAETALNEGKFSVSLAENNVFDPYHRQISSILPLRSEIRVSGIREIDSITVNEYGIVVRFLKPYR